jgi:glycosyltransferase involved in cell wall biosynthesis
LRIVHVVGGGYLPQETAGTQIHVRDLCRGLRQRGHEVEVFTRLAGYEQGEFELSRSAWDGVPVTGITNNYTDLDRFELLYTHPVIDARFDDFLGEAQPDLVNVHHFTGLSTSMIEVARRRRLPVVMGLHDYWMVCLRGQRIRPDDLGICDTLDRQRCLSCLNRLWPHLLPLSGSRSLMDRLLGRPPSLEKLQKWENHVRRMLGSCQVLTAPSGFHRDRFLEWGVDPSRLIVAPYGLVSHELRAYPRVDRDPRHIGFIGSVIPSKGVHVLCEAFRRLDRGDLVLHIHGEAPSFHGDTGYVNRLHRFLGEKLDVRFHGRYEHCDLPTILAGLDVLVVPSLWWESFCLTAREGALAGLPVIASRLGALEEAVEEGIALGFRAGDPDDLARALARVLSEPGLRDTLRRKAARIRSLEESITRMEEIYRTAMGPEQGRGVAPSRDG